MHYVPLSPGFACATETSSPSSRYDDWRRLEVEFRRNRRGLKKIFGYNLNASNSKELGLTWIGFWVLFLDPHIRYYTSGSLAAAEQLALQIMRLLSLHHISHQCYVKDHSTVCCHLVAKTSLRWQSGLNQLTPALFFLTKTLACKNKSCKNSDLWLW